MLVIRKWAFLSTTIRQVNSPHYHPLLAGTRSQRTGLAALDRPIWHGSPALTPTTQLTNTRTHARRASCHLSPGWPRPIRRVARGGALAPVPFSRKTRTVHALTTNSRLLDRKPTYD